MKHFTLKAAAKKTGVSKSKIWRAVNDDQLIARKGKTSGGQEAWLVRADHLERWEKNYLSDSETVVEDSFEQLEILEEVEVVQEFQTHSEVFSQVSQSDSNHFEANQGPPVELYLALVDKVARSERKSVELEVELRKYRLLLTENAESLQENRAEVVQEQAKATELEEALEAANQTAETAKRETALAKIEMETLKTEMAAKESVWEEARRPWYKKLFSKSS